MCRVLTVSRYGYYDRHGRPPPDRGQANVRLAAYVQRVYTEHRGHAGASRIAERLRAKAARKHMATTNSNHNLPVAPNLLAQVFTAARPNCKGERHHPCRD